MSTKRPHAYSLVFFCGLAVCCALITASCGRSPQAYLEKGNQYFAAGKYDDAILNYRKAIQKDARFGEAFYRLALADLKKKDYRDAYATLTSAAGLLRRRTDVQVALADLALPAYMGDKRRPARLYEQLTKISDQLLAQDPNSFDGLRIKGNLAWSDGKLKEASAIFAKANAVKPLEPNLAPAWTQVLFVDGRAEEGERLAQEFLQKHKDSRQIYDVLYEHYRSQDRLADAENILRTKVQNNPVEIDYALQLAGYYAASGKHEQMAAVLRSVSDPKVFPNAYLKTGDFYSAHHEWPEALRQYEEGGKANPKERILFLRRIADSWLAQGKGEEAASVVNEILKEQPTDANARAVSASLLLKKGKAEESVAIFQDLVKESPDNALWRLSLGRALAAKGDLDGARGQLQESLKARPDFMAARLALADVSRRKHDYREELRYANEVLAVNANLRQARLLRTVGLIGTQQYAEARSSLTGLEKDYPQSSDVQYQIAALDLAQKKYPAAEARLQKLYAEGKGDPRALTVLVDAYRDEGHVDKALSLLASEVKKSPESPIPRALLADTALSSRNYDLALEHYQFLLAKGVRSEQLQMRLGVVYELKGNYPQAVASFQMAKSLAPRDAAANLALADALRLAGRDQEAIASYRSALALSPENPKAMNSLAFLLVNADGKVEEAETLVQRALQKAPQESDYRDTLGLVYLKRNLKDSAVTVFQNLVNKHPDNPLYRYHYGLALFQTGQNARAKAELQTALPKKPPENVRKGIETALAKMR
jgi:tetratricopeptide (TPR) repeat protein